MNELSPKERMKIARHAMPAQDAATRVHNFDEVNIGYDLETATQEALRCLQCKDAPCMQGCPVHVHIPNFIQKIIEGKVMEGVDIILQDNLLPAVCGRVCPQENMCEALCILGKKGDAVAVGNLERFTADYTAAERAKRMTKKTPSSTGKKVAVVGSGPSSLACAGDLIRFGHAVTVFEALHTFGGVLVFGIPEFRLPKEVVRFEIEALEKLGVRFEKNVVIGLTLTLKELMVDQGYDAVFIGAGAGLPHFLGIPGEELIGIYTSNELLTRVNLMKAYQHEAITPVLHYEQARVAVFGAGNTALDSARTALRLGAKKVTIMYRRTEAEMPARREEIHHAKEEGIAFIFLVAPLEFIDNGEGWLKAVRLQRMELGEPDKSNRRRPIPIVGSEYVEEIDLAVIAIGNGTNPLLRHTPGLKFSERNTLIVDPDTLQTTLKGVYAGGDIVTGGATVISAMGAGRQAARSIHQYLTE